MTEKYTTYSGYLKLDQLLSLQEEKSAPASGQAAEHDEMLFIIIHQVYELWFKQILHELDHVKRSLAEERLPRALHGMKRILTILKVNVAQLDILETMTPLDFLAFRKRLDAASGLESFQFRELEFVLGHKRRSVFARYPEGSHARGRLEARYAEPTIWDAFLRFLASAGHPIPESALTRDVTEPVRSNEEVQKVLVLLYRNDTRLVPLCERLLDLDEGIQEWRYRHVKMVQRTIGMKPGTGGTTGVEYLTATLMAPVFPDLWEIRSRL